MKYRNQHIRFPNNRSVCGGCSKPLTKADLDPGYCNDCLDRSLVAKFIDESRRLMNGLV